MHRRLFVSSLVAGALALSAVACAGPGAAAGAPAPGPRPTYPVGTFVQALASLLQPGSAQQAPPGANVPGCQLSPQHPYPVILVHGTFENQHFNWLQLAPELADAGYCVYTFNYGADAFTFGTFYGLGDIAASAAQLQTEVQTVLHETGASQVDLVGHSQGGMMPRYYIDDLGGAPYVHELIGLAPSNYGTTFYGLVTLVQDLGLLGVLNDLVADIGPALPEQEQGSPFLTALNANPTEPGVTYLVIETKDDEVVTPYTNAFLPAAPNVTNVTVQDQCPADHTGHVGMVFDGVVEQDVLNALAGTDTPVTCSPSAYGPGI